MYAEFIHTCTRDDFARRVSNDGLVKMIDSPKGLMAVPVVKYEMDYAGFFAHIKEQFCKFPDISEIHYYLLNHKKHWKFTEDSLEENEPRPEVTPPEKQWLYAAVYALTSQGRKIEILNEKVLHDKENRS